MVLEHLFPNNWLERKAQYAFILGFVYSVIGILIAKVLFPADPALVAVAFTALLLLPEMYKLISIEEKKEEREKKFSVFKLFNDNRDFIKTYLFIAMGVFFVYAFGALLLPEFQVNQLFREQLEMRMAGNAVAGNATAFSEPLFYDILLNNWWVLLACFFISLLTGDGAVFLITWNASVWGTIFGVTARNAAIASQASPFLYLSMVLIIVLPHAIIEITSYILAAISGGVISKDVLLEKYDSFRFKAVFQYNFWLFIFAIIVLIIGALLETWVLVNVDLYRDIIIKSYMV